MVVFYNTIDISALNAIFITMKVQIYLQCQKGVRRALLITLAKSPAGKTANYEPSDQRLYNPIYTNKRRISCICDFEKKKTQEIYDLLQRLSTEHLL